MDTSDRIYSSEENEDNLTWFEAQKEKQLLDETVEKNELRVHQHVCLLPNYNNNSDNSGKYMQISTTAWKS